MTNFLGSIAKYSHKQKYKSCKHTQTHKKKWKKRKRVLNKPQKSKFPDEKWTDRSRIAQNWIMGNDLSIKTTKLLCNGHELKFEFENWLQNWNKISLFIQHTYWKLNEERWVENKYVWLRVLCSLKVEFFFFFHIYS